MDIFSIFTLLGGIGLFLYGIDLLGKSLEKIAGAGLERTLEKLTNNPLKGLALGTVVTGVIQSSAATTIMLMSFVNAGIMQFAQTVPVIMGANIGTTVTGQLLRLGDISDSSVFLQLLQPTTFAPVVIAIGAFMLLASKKERVRDIASLLIGFGILFFGMNTMETALEPLSESEAFQQLFTLFENPLLGVMVGALVTALLQSSSASVGVLQAIASTGTVTFSMAAPIIIGQNIGKCVTVMIASLGSGKNAKRVVASHLVINLFGAALFLIVIYGWQLLVGFPFWGSAMSRGNIADFHTLFNVVTSLVLLPFSGYLVKLVEKIIPDGEEEKRQANSLALLDMHFMDRPTVALEQCRKVCMSMTDVIMKNYDMAVTIIKDFDHTTYEKICENENFLDKCETELSEYLVHIMAQNLRENDQKQAAEYLHCVSDFERIGDHCMNIAEIGKFNLDRKITFSKKGMKEIRLTTEAVRNVLTITFDAFTTNDLTTAKRVEPLEEVIDVMRETIKDHHIERLGNGKCSVQAGISLTEFLTSAERISDHCSNIALHVIECQSNAGSFDIHEYQHMMHSGGSEEYKALYAYYDSKYCQPLQPSNNNK